METGPCFWGSGTGFQQKHYLLLLKKSVFAFKKHYFAFKKSVFVF